MRSENLPSDAAGDETQEHYGFPVFLVIGFVGAFFTALTFMLSLQASLPPDDGAYRPSVLSMPSDPFAAIVAIPGALFGGAFAAPLLYFCLRRRRLRTALPIIFASVLATVIVLTSFDKRIGLLGSFAALIVSSIFCASARVTRRAV